MSTNGVCADIIGAFQWTLLATFMILHSKRTLNIISMSLVGGGVCWQLDYATFFPGIYADVHGHMLFTDLLQNLK